MMMNETSSTVILTEKANMTSTTAIITVTDTTTEMTTELNIHGRATKRSRLNRRAKAKKEYEYHKQIIRELQDQYQFDESSSCSYKSTESSENNNEGNKREFKDELSDIGFSRVTTR